METNERLNKLEEKLDAMHTDLVEIKAGLRFANAVAKAFVTIAGLILAYLGIK